MEEIISLKEIINIIRSRIILIWGVTVTAISIAFIISFYILIPLYKAETQILVNQNSNEQVYSWESTEIDLQLINTYKLIVTSPVILDRVIEKLELNLTSNQLKNQIKVTNASNSKVVNIEVLDESPQRAVELANTIAEVFMAQNPSIMSVDNISILAPATLSDNPSPVKPQKILNVIIGLIVGLMVGIAIAFILEFMDNTIKDEVDVEELLELPIMGVINSIPINSKKLTAYKSRRIRRTIDAEIKKV